MEEYVSLSRGFLLVPFIIIIIIIFFLWSQEGSRSASPQPSRRTLGQK
jgi:hypothetical protein